MHSLLDFEKPIAELENKIEALRMQAGDSAASAQDEIEVLRFKVEKLLKATYAKLTPWQKVQVARHPNRPHLSLYIEHLITGFVPLAGDRQFAEDAAIIGGLGRFRGRSVVIIGQEKGSDTMQRVKHNFGSAKPEGYRKAQRLMELADTFKLPVLSFVDTAGAYPGVASEERGQAQAIARSIELCLSIQVPFVSVVIGEGGSGGAIAIAAADRVLMLEHAIYSVISPEGCASILWRSADNAQDAAQALRLTAQDLKELKVIDEIIPEPMGGAHRDARQAVAATEAAIEKALVTLGGIDGPALLRARRDRFLAMGTGL
jgi:acetyl-CoA carboxylase carboxyl transferase subunit alpha